MTPALLIGLQAQVIDNVQAVGASLSRDALGWVAGSVGIIINVLLVVILSIYFLANGSRVAGWFWNETPVGSVRSRACLLVTIVNRVVVGYVRGVLAMAGLIGLLVGAGLAVLGVPYALLMGVLAFFMEFVPVLGVLISGVASVGIALIYFHDLFHPLMVLVYFVVVHVVESYLVGPRIMGRAVGIHPAAGLIAVKAGTELFGVWGALFAAPLAGLLQAIATAAWLEFRTGGTAGIAALAASELAVQADERSWGALA